MASFKPTIITKKGHALMAKIVAGKATPKFTKISVSDHEYSSSTNFESVTKLSNIKQTTLVSSVSKINNAAVKVSGALSNAELSTGYYLRTIGLYATDPTEGEILYSITTATKPDWIPPNNGVSASSIMIDLITVVSNASNVSIDVDPNATATVAQINELKDEMDKNKTVPFSTEGKSVTSYPMGTKGLFNSGVNGVEPLFNHVDNGVDYGNWNVVIPSTKGINGIHMEHPTDSSNVPIGGIKENTLYTLAYQVLSSKIDSGIFQIHSGTLIPRDISLNNSIGIRAITFTTASDKDLTLLKFKIGGSKDGDFVNFKVLGIYVGDQTNNPNIMIERPDGLIESALSYDLVSRKENIMPIKTISQIDRNAYTVTSYVGYIPIKPNTQYTVSYKTEQDVHGAWNVGHGNRLWAIPLPNSVHLPISWGDAHSLNGSSNNHISLTGTSTIQTREADIILAFFSYVPGTCPDSTGIYDEIMVMEGNVKRSSEYKPYITTKTGFSVPRPLIKIGDVEDKINEKGELIYANSKTITFNDTDNWSLDHTFDDTYRFSVQQDWENIDTTVDGIYGRNSTIIFQGKNYPMLIEANIDSEHHYLSIHAIYIFVNKTLVDNMQGTSVVNKFKNLLASDSVYLIYELKTPEIIYDGEKGYQAPSPLPAYQNGDLILLPKHHKKYQANSTTTLTLDEEICDLDYARTEINGKVVDLDCTLESDGKTVTIPETTGWVDIKGTIPSKNCLNPEICADMPANLGTITSANTTSIANLQQKYDKHENIQDLINLEMDYRLTILENK